MPERPAGAPVPRCKTCSDSMVVPDVDNPVVGNSCPDCVLPAGAPGVSGQEAQETSDAVRGDLHGTPGEWPERQPMTPTGSGTPQAQPGRGRQSDACDRPPEGWECSRPRGHDGPCAAVPLDAPSDPASARGAMRAARDALEGHGDRDRALRYALGREVASDPASVLSRLLESDRERTVRALEGEGFVEASKVAKWLRHIDRLDEIAGAVALRHAGFNPLWDAANAIEREFGRSLLSKAPKEDG